MEKMDNRVCQICQKNKSMDNFYTAKSYICKECNSFVTNVSRFKKIIKKEGIDFAYNLLLQEELLLKAKNYVLNGQTINGACRAIKRGIEI